MSLAVPTRGANSLPQGLTDHIIGCLVGDYTSLLACSLVCRSWCAESSRLLFKTLCASGAETRGLFLLLQSSERVRGCVSRLVLGHDYVLRAAFKMMMMVQTEPGELVRHCITLEELLEIVSCLPRLKELDVGAMTISYQHSEHTLARIHSMHHQLEVLRLVDMSSQMLDSYCLLTLLSAFDRISTVNIAYTDTFSGPTGSIQALPAGFGPSRLVHVARLSIMSRIPTSFVWMLDLLERSINTELLTRLEVNCFVGEYNVLLPPTCKFIARCLQLEELHLHLRFMHWAISRLACSLLAPAAPSDTPLPANFDQPWPLPDLSSHKRLRILHVGGFHPRTVLPDERAAIVWPFENMLWADMMKMIQSASDSVQIVLLGITEVMDTEEKTEELHSLSRRIPGTLGLLHTYDWSLLGTTLAALPHLKQAFLVGAKKSATSLFDERHWRKYPVTMRVITQKLPAQVQQIFSFAVSIMGYLAYLPA